MLIQFLGVYTLWLWAELLKFRRYMLYPCSWLKYGEWSSFCVCIDLLREAMTGESGGWWSVWTKRNRQQAGCQKNREIRSNLWILLCVSNFCKPINLLRS
jgi:hypothetical protein